MAPVGVLASVINDVRLRDLLNARLVPDAPARLTPGAAGARMIRQGLGCAHRPRSWTPPGCAHPPPARGGVVMAFGRRWAPAGRGAVQAMPPRPRAAPAACRPWPGASGPTPAVSGAARRGTPPAWHAAARPARCARRTPAPRWRRASWWGPPPYRRHGRLRGMMCAVWVASVAPRRLRRCGEAVGALEQMSSG
jgi:hypothetical protein